ncbi:MAG: class I SAM-dependent methyltransferase [Marinagarivorans sp.]|nr:class I SAM-dependent methyltransferase [Marinagarivorans sp.]
MFLKNASTETIEDCNNCETPSSLRNRRYEKFLMLPSHYGVICCPKCQLSWLSPRPTADSFKELYRFENYFSGEHVPQNYEEISQSRLYFFEQRLLKAVGHRTGSLRVLEIGAATGEFLNIAAKYGHHVYGVELSSDARAVAKKNYQIDLVENIDQLELGLDYDLIHLNHVLEHVPNPKALLTQLAKKISPTGIIVIEVPQQFDNDLDRLRRAIFFFKKKKFDAFSLHHTYFFGCENLRSMSESVGLHVVSLKTALPEKTPFRTPLFKNILLRGFLFLADKMHKGGNIIEIKLTRNIENV